MVRVLVFSVLNVGELIHRLTCSRNLKQCMHMEHIFLKTPLSIYFNLFYFFPNFKAPNSGCSSSASMAYMQVLTVSVGVIYKRMMLHNGQVFSTGGS